MVLAGETAEAGRVPGERLDTDIITADTANVDTTETVLASVAAPVVQGRTYKIVFDGAVQLSVADDQFLVHIREDSVTGTQIGSRRVTAASTNVNQPFHFEGEYTAAATGTKTIVLTFERVSGTGTIHIDAGLSNPSYFYIEYNRG